MMTSIPPPIPHEETLTDDFIRLLMYERGITTPEIDALRTQLRRISWIVNKPRYLSQHANEAELWRQIVTEVQATFLVPPNTPDFVAAYNAGVPDDTRAPQNGGGE